MFHNIILKCFPKVNNNIFNINNLFLLSNTFHKIYYGFDNEKYILSKHFQNSKSEKKKEKESKIKKINSKLEYKLSPKFVSLYKYSLIESSSNNIQKSIFKLSLDYCKNFIRKRYNKSDTKIIISDITTSISNIKYNSRFYLSPKILSKLMKFKNIQIFSTTSKALSILNTTYVNNIAELENKIKYLFEQILINNFKNLSVNNKSICSDSILLLFNTIYGKNKKYPINVDMPTLIESEVSGKEIKYIRFKVNVLEYNINSDKIEENIYIIEVRKNNKEKNLEKNFYNLIFTNIQLLETNTMLI